METDQKMNSIFGIRIQFRTIWVPIKPYNKSKYFLVYFRFLVISLLFHQNDYHFRIHSNISSILITGNPNSSGGLYSVKTGRTYTYKQYPWICLWFLRVNSICMSKIYQSKLFHRVYKQLFYILNLPWFLHPNPIQIP